LFPPGQAARTGKDNFHYGDTEKNKKYLPLINEMNTDLKIRSCAGV
jgi:hypothetical protein